MFDKRGGVGRVGREMKGDEGNGRKEEDFGFGLRLEKWVRLRSELRRPEQRAEIESKR
ncbi:uncharacterized protein G2W53_013096 [Senna tora]|uniref:Uncharacterized protein n=1 Tax=Senna tora TaxID=362788 RepID=A0A834WR14_9FABA|nr:uncharacterized protein G2W53_013096 [Senna tora]